MKKILPILLLTLSFSQLSLSGVRRSGILPLWCYSCVSSQPGCGDVVDWRIQHSITCPKEKDKCIKIIETKGSDTFITRDCLSNLEGLRRDIPADTYEGCRSAAEMPKLAVYVDNNIKELDLKRDYWDKTEYCFCEFDMLCNGGTSLLTSIALLLVSLYNIL